MEQKVEFRPAWDRRDPDPSKNYGIGAVEISMALIGDKGTVEFTIRTNWLLPQNIKAAGSLGTNPHLNEIWIHSKKPIYKGQNKSTGHCKFTGGICYTSSSFALGKEVWQKLLEKGSDEVWKELEIIYNAQFLK